MNIPERYVVASVYEDAEFFVESQRILWGTLFIGIVLNYTLSFVAILFNLQEVGTLCCVLARDNFLMSAGNPNVICYRTSLISSFLVGTASAVFLLIKYKARVLDKRKFFPITLDSILTTFLLSALFLFFLYFIFLYAPIPRDGRPLPKMAAVFLWPAYPALAGFGSAILAMVVFEVIGSFWKAVIYKVGERQ